MGLLMFVLVCWCLYVFVGVCGFGVLCLYGFVDVCVGFVLVCGCLCWFVGVCMCLLMCVGFVLFYDELTSKKK